MHPKLKIQRTSTQTNWTNKPTQVRSPPTTSGMETERVHILEG